MTQQREISLEMQVEDLASAYPEAVGFLMRRGLRCIRCGEPVWGTLGAFLEEAGIENPQALVDQLNQFLNQLNKKT